MSYNNQTLYHGINCHLFFKIGVKMQKITIYSKTTCPYCDMAKNLLRQKGITEFNEIKIDNDDQKREEMIARTSRKTVPQIFIGDYHVGGFDDLSKLNNDNKLDELLKNK